MSDISDLDLLSELGVDLAAEAPQKYTTSEARLVAGFEDIIEFFKEHGRAPQQGAEKDIFERIYAVRLGRLRTNPDAAKVLADLDHYDLLVDGELTDRQEHGDRELLAELGVEVSDDDASDITKLRHVSPVAHRRAAEEVAGREVCRDFEKFDPFFAQVREDLKNGVRVTRESATQEDITIGSFFIVKGQLAYVAEKGEEFKATGKNAMDARLRVVFDNGTESNLLLRSLQRSLYGEDRSRVISSPNAGPLFSGHAKEDDETGTIYVLRSKSEIPEILPIRDAILKIGVTGGDVRTRIASAKTDATYLLGEVEVVDEYKLYNINRQKLEKMLHRIFADARLSISIKDRFGNPFIPREWFMVTRDVVGEAVDLIQSGEISNRRYDFKNARFVVAE